jgi:hypothetical protein
MNPTIEAIREALHAQPVSTHYEGCWERHGWCAVAYLLDAAENLKSSDLKTEVECDHMWVSKAGAGYRENPVEICTKCGEKL